MGTWDWEVSSMWFTISIWPHHVGTAGCSTRRTLIRKCSKDSAFPCPCPYSVLPVLPKKKIKNPNKTTKQKPTKKPKKCKVLLLLKFLKRLWKRSYCSELRWKAKALKTLERLEFEGRKKSSAYLCKEQSWPCMLGRAPSSGLAPITFKLHFPLLTSKLNYFGRSNWTFLFQNTKMGYFEFFLWYYFQIKILSGTSYFRVNNFTLKQLGNSNEKMVKCSQPALSITSFHYYPIKIAPTYRCSQECHVTEEEITKPTKWLTFQR